MPKLILLTLAAAAFAFAQQTDLNNKPNVFLDNKGKPPKPSEARTITGIVKDKNDNPIAGAIVQIKDMKTAKVIDFPTKDDGKFAFRELSMQVDYTLTAKRDGLAPEVKKVSPYDTRHDVILTFHLEPPAPPSEKN